MFYCDECAQENDWPSETGRLFAIPRSYGACELCKKLAPCYDVPSSALPLPEPKEPPH